MNDQVNLLQNTGGRNYTNLITKLRVMRLIAVSALFIIGAFSIMLFLIIAFSPLPRLHQEEAQYVAQLNSGEYREKMDKYYFINARLTDIDALLSERPEILSSYELIEGIFTPGLQVNFLDIAERRITFSVSSPDLTEVEVAVSTLTEKVKNNKRIASMTLSGITYNARDNVYEMVVMMAES